MNPFVFLLAFTARSHWMQMTLDFIYAMVAMVQNSFPLRFKEIHIVNENPYFSMAYNLVSPYLTDKIRKRIQFHGDNFQGTIIPKYKPKPKHKVKTKSNKKYLKFSTQMQLHQTSISEPKQELKYILSLHLKGKFTKFSNSHKRKC